MMKILVATLTIAACVLGITAVSAQDFPFCLNSCSYGSCTFSTMQQCQATASGLDGWCERNPNYRQPNAAITATFTTRRGASGGRFRRAY